MVKRQKTFKFALKASWQVLFNALERKGGFTGLIRAAPNKSRALSSEKKIYVPKKVCLLFDNTVFFTTFDIVIENVELVTVSHGSANVSLKNTASVWSVFNNSVRSGWPVGSKRRRIGHYMFMMVLTRLCCSITNQTLGNTSCSMFLLFVAMWFNSHGPTNNNRYRI